MKSVNYWVEIESFDGNSDNRKTYRGVNAVLFPNVNEGD